MPRQTITTANAPRFAAPQPGVKAGPILVVSGIAGIDPRTGKLAGDTIQHQARQTLTDCRAILEAGGADLDDVIEAGVLLTNPADFPGRGWAVAAIRTQADCRTVPASARAPRQHQSREDPAQRQETRNSPSARLSTWSTCSSSRPTSPTTCNFAGAGAGKPQIGLAARPASRSYEGRRRRHTAAEASPVFATSAHPVFAAVLHAIGVCRAADAELELAAVSRKRLSKDGGLRWLLRRCFGHLVLGGEMAGARREQPTPARRRDRFPRTVVVTLTIARATE